MALFKSSPGWDKVSVVGRTFSSITLASQTSGVGVKIELSSDSFDQVKDRNGRLVRMEIDGIDGSTFLCKLVTEPPATHQPMIIES